MSDKRGIDEGTVYNVSALISNPYLQNKNSPRGDFEISTWESLFPDMAPYRYVPENGKTGTRRTFAKTCC